MYRMSLTMIVSCTLLPSCVTPHAQNGRTQASDSGRGGDLRRRAERFWTAKQNDDWSIVFSFLSPTERNDATLAEYVAWAEKNEPFLISDFKLKRVQTDGDDGWVEMTYEATLRRFATLSPKETTRWQSWHRSEGTWYPVPARERESCAEPPAKRNRAEEITLLTRFRESWQMRYDRDWSGLYTLTDPRDHEEVEEHHLAEAEERIVYVDYEVDWVEVIKNRGRVRVLYRHKLADPNLSKLAVRGMYVTEDWIMLDNTWYRDLIR